MANISDKIIIIGARENNLKNIAVEIPKNKNLFYWAVRNLTAGSHNPAFVKDINYVR